MFRNPGVMELEFCCFFWVYEKLLGQHRRLLSRAKRSRELRIGLAKRLRCSFFTVCSSNSVCDEILDFPFHRT